MTDARMSEEEFDEYFDDGGDISQLIVEESVRFPGRDEETKRISLNMPAWLVDELDAAAKHYAASRQSIINVWLSEKLNEERKAQDAA